MKNTLIISTLISLAMFATAPAQYDGWQHSGALCILTTPDGASLPESVLEENFPLLVRLNRETFDFSQAKANGEDVRFSADGKPLGYQIEEWDAAKGRASIWVRIPVIKGNARQEIKLHWGKADAPDESKGSAVFNESNGFLSVFHLGDPAEPVKDEVGKITATNVGTTASAGIIGGARHFEVGKGINCGEAITTLPVGSSPHTTEAWFRAEAVNTTIVGWGIQTWQGKVVMQLESPSHMNMDCFFADCNVAGASTIPMSQWVHVVNTYKKGESKVYVNGVLDGSNIAGAPLVGKNSNNHGAPLAIKRPSRMDIGGWCNNYQFVGDIDEVRISKVTRSADWVKLEYENQKPMQTLVGFLAQPGTDFSASEKQLTVVEGNSATVKATAGGAQKVYWILEKGGIETIADVDKFEFTINAGRVTGDQALTLQFRAVYADKVKTLEIPVTIREDIPDPVFSLKAPAKWDGREPIEVVAQISNLENMQEKNVGNLKYDWKVSDMAVIKAIEPGKLVLKRSQNSGNLAVTATIDNGGKPVAQTARIEVKEPQKDAWVLRTPDKDEKAVDNQFYARDDKNEGTLYYNGTLPEPADSVFLKLYADDKLIKTENQKPSADKAYAFTLKLKPGLIKYKVEFGKKIGDTETVLQTVANLVCGDAYLIDGQSNALATDTGEQAPAETSDWIRSYGRPSGNPKDNEMNLWCNPVWKAQKGEKAELGWWGMELAKRLVASQKLPIFIINGAVGGTRIDQHQRNETDHTDATTIYGRMLWRVEQAKLTHGIRGILWHQGENNQGSAAPTGDFDWKSYQDYFVEMSAAWKQDFPNLQHYYIFQIWPNSCSMGGKSGCGDMIREKQRTLTSFFSNMDCMSTLGIKPPGSCHYPLTGWAEFARLMQPLIERDNYGKTPTASITAPNLKRASYSASAKDSIELEFDQPVVWHDLLISEFYLDGVDGMVVAGSVSGNVVTLKLKEASAAKRITYLKDANWSQDRLLIGANGIAALTFAEVEIGTGR
ncbi:MAG: DUF2341 domain-containing protein [Akkermansiaceae bacterium]|nr:DUF2341 domain-containing protein [Akkermansiaceae bacterium]